MNNEQLDIYFDWLDISDRTLSFELVETIIKKHLSTFCFSGIAAFQEQEVSNNIDDIFKKIVIIGNGGYCFEQNKLLYEVLNAIGFSVQISLARVVREAKFDVPRTHQVTLLKWENETYLLDVGFGPDCPPFPINLREGTCHGLYKMSRNAKGDYQLEKEKGEAHTALYTFDNNTYNEADCLMSNFYSYAHPKATFRNNLVVSRILPDVIYSFRNGLHFIIRGTEVQKIIVTNGIHLQEILFAYFKLDYPEEACDLLWEKLQILKEI